MKKLSTGILLLFTGILIINCRLWAQNALTGSWDGTLVVSGMKLGINLHIRTQAGSFNGTIDIPAQNAMSLPLSNIKLEGNKVHFELATPGMAQRLACFDGEFKDSLMLGDFSQAGAKGSFNVKRSVDILLKETPAPYKQEEVTFKNGDITIAGTLTLPEEPGSFPAVVLITGSGQQNRDEEIFGFKIFKILADNFTRNGIAVLRLDDRGIGGTSGNPAASTTADFAADIQSALEFLKSRTDIKQSQIGLLGHSEGGLIAQMISSKENDLAFIILMSGPGLKGDSLIMSQIYYSLKTSGASQEVINKQTAIQRKIYAALRTDKGWDEVKAELKEPIEKAYDKLSVDTKKQMPPKDQYLNMAVEERLSHAKSPWFRYFIDADPAVYLEQVKCPVLMLFGTKDTQVFAEENKNAMIKALEKGGNKNYTVKIFPGANHLYQNAITGDFLEYSTLPKEFVPGFTDFTADWIKQTLKIDKSK